jgi:hypothetical protein
MNKNDLVLQDEKQLAGYLGVTVHALRRWRFEGRGPRFIHVGRLVRYRPEDVEAWLDAQPTGGAVAA